MKIKMNGALIHGDENRIAARTPTIAPSGKQSDKVRLLMQIKSPRWTCERLRCQQAGPSHLHSAARTVMWCRPSSCWAGCDPETDETLNAKNQNGTLDQHRECW